MIAVASLSKKGRSSVLVGTTNGSFPLGLTRPSNTSANAWPPSCPGYQSMRMPATLSRQAPVITALPDMIATTVRGFASATAWMSRSSSSWSARESRSPP